MSVQKCDDWRSLEGSKFIAENDLLWSDFGVFFKNITFYLYIPWQSVPILSPTCSSRADPVPYSYLANSSAICLSRSKMLLAIGGDVYSSGLSLMLTLKPQSMRGRRPPRVTRVNHYVETPWWYDLFVGSTWGGFTSIDMSYIIVLTLRL